MATMISPKAWQAPNDMIPRGTRRAAVSLPALIQILGRQHSARVHNLSTGGAMIETAAAVHEGTHVILSCGTIETRGLVAWVKPDRFGLRFLAPVDEEQVVRQLFRSDAAADRRRSREATRLG